MTLVLGHEMKSYRKGSIIGLRATIILMTHNYPSSQDTQETKNIVVKKTQTNSPYLY